MRSEFLSESARFSGFAEAINRTQHLVPRMHYERLLHAIRRPAELYGGEITLELAERLIADVRGPASRTQCLTSKLLTDKPNAP